MKARVLLIPMILTTSIAIAQTQPSDSSHAGDAQRQAAALLSHSHASGGPTSGALSASRASVARDAHASAAALLSGDRADSDATVTLAVNEQPRRTVYGDAHAHAAALLSGVRISSGLMGP
jgi:hypothetical protein